MEKKQVVRNLIILLLSLNLLLLLYFLYQNQFARKENAYKSSAQNNANEPFGYFSQIRNFERESRQNDEIILLGDSQTAGNSFWKTNLGKENIINRGIPSDSINGLLYRMDETLRSKPRQLFVEIGINDIRNIEFDLYHERAYLTYITNNYKKLFDTLQTRLPDTEIYVTIIFPTVERSISNCFQCNYKIDTMNNRLERLCNSYNFKYLNIHKNLLRSKGTREIDVRYTYDGLHLNAEGYKIWEAALLKEIEKK